MKNKADKIKDLKSKGYSNDEIAYKLGYLNTSYVRKVLSISKAKSFGIVEKDINFLKKKLNIPAKVAKNILELKHFLKQNPDNMTEDFQKILILLENLTKE